MKKAESLKFCKIFILMLAMVFTMVSIPLYAQEFSVASYDPIQARIFNGSSYQNYTYNISLTDSYAVQNANTPFEAKYFHYVCPTAPSTRMITFNINYFFYGFEGNGNETDLYFQFYVGFPTSSLFSSGASASISFYKDGLRVKRLPMTLYRALSIFYLNMAHTEFFTFDYISFEISDYADYNIDYTSLYFSNMTIMQYDESASVYAQEFEKMFTNIYGSSTPTTDVVNAFASQDVTEGNILTTLTAFASSYKPLAMSVVTFKENMAQWQSGGQPTLALYSGFFGAWWNELGSFGQMCISTMIVLGGLCTLAGIGASISNKAKGGKS